LMLATGIWSNWGSVARKRKLYILELKYLYFFLLQHPPLSTFSGSHSFEPLQEHPEYLSIFYLCVKGKVSGHYFQSWLKSPCSFPLPPPAGSKVGLVIVIFYFWLEVPHSSLWG
jgi:hypothetical protein